MSALTSNPFATRYTRPGAVGFLFPPGQSADALVAKLAEHGWWGAILGPHGAGKSTLLHTLKTALEDAGRSPVMYTLNQGQRSLPIGREEAEGWNEATQTIVDGYEQLGWWGRWRLKRLCRMKGAGLLVTAHAPMDIADLYRVEPSVEATQRVVAALLEHSKDQSQISPLRLEESVEPNQPVPTGVINADDVAAAFSRQQGNVRETLFELHDLYRRRIAAS